MVAPNNLGGQWRIGSSPIPEISSAAAQYRRKFGITSPENDYSRSAINPARSDEIGNAYLQMPAYDKAAEPAFRKFRDETNRQFDHMTAPRSKGGLGLSVEVTSEDPYGWGSQTPGEDHSNWDYSKVMPEMRHDVTENNRMKVYSTKSTGGHPFLTDDDNDRFRAVHDVFGHLGTGRGIDFNGEEAAFQGHAAMYTPLARQAMATETRGQNAALRVTGNFQDQKVGILPARMQVPRNLSGVQFSDIQMGRQKNKEQGL